MSKPLDVNAAGGPLAGSVAPFTPPDQATAKCERRTSRKRQQQGRALALKDPEPWPDPVDGAQLADDMAETIRRFVLMEPEAVTAATLWAFHAHALDAAQVSPLLVASSPTRRCGKSTLETVVSALVPRPLVTSNVSEAALYRTVEKHHPTLIVDEADSFVRMREELRGLLNAGHTRAGALVVRAVGEDFEPRAFTTWCPKMVALIGRLPGTLEDRSIAIPMRRRRPDELVARLRLDRLAELEPLRQKLARWTRDNVDALKRAEPAVPEELNDRAQDNWRPLLAIADRLGGEWPERAPKAALVLAGLEPETEDPGEALLRDLRPLIAERRDRGDEAVSSEDVVAHLVALEGSPWSEWRDGRPIMKAGVARLLKRFGIAPRQVRLGSETRKGYVLDGFDDVLARYPLPSEPKQAKQAALDAGETDFPQPKHGGGAERSVSVAEGASQPHQTRRVSPVSDTKEGGGAPLAAQARAYVDRLLEGAP